MCFTSLDENTIKKLFLNDQIDYVNIFPHYILYTTTKYITYNTEDLPVITKNMPLPVEELFEGAERGIIYVNVHETLSIDHVSQFVENVSLYLKSMTSNKVS